YAYSQQELGSVADGLRDLYGLEGISLTVSTACSSSAKAFKTARLLLQSNVADAVLVGGVDSLCEMTLRGFHSLELTASQLCNPFSRNRDGINIGEGAAIFVLTKETGGIQLLGVGESSDAYHMSAPEPSGQGAIAAMHAALKEAELTPDDIRYLNLHGTGTAHNDSAESRAVEAVFTDCLPACSSSKPLFGHTLGAAGAIELGVCWSLFDEERSGIAFPVHVWDGVQDSELPRLPLIAESHVQDRVGPCYCMSNSFAFGGSNCSVVLGLQ
ncbi:MAG: beta-ketoacyl-ACP synthase, partial [Bdellovibrionales bacterium]|nr:beta-ketoacyl-ACP synthase [Bdellovibrionales bacterium]